MTNIPPSRLVLRCYGHRKRNSRYYGVCLNFNLAAEADTPEALRSKLAAMIASYAETVLDTDDRESIPNLFSRRAPVYDWIKYGCIKILILFNNFYGEFTFKEFIPIHLARNCR